MKRSADELVEYLFRDNTFPDGCVLLTGTGVVPPDEFTLVQGDLVAIAIDGIGTLENVVRGGHVADTRHDLGPVCLVRVPVSAAGLEHRPAQFVASPRRQSQLGR